MKKRFDAVAILGAGALALAAQSPGLRRVPAPDGVVDREAWREMVAIDDLAQREGAYGDLLRAARAEPGALSELEGWLHEESDPTLAWTLRLALRELEGATVPPASNHPFGRGFFGSDPFRSGPFGTGPFGGGAFGQGGFGWPEDLQREMQELMDSYRNRAPGVRSHSQSFQMQSGPDGVRVEVREQGEDGEESKTYEADSLEQLLEQYPHLADRIDVMPRGLPRGLDALPFAPRTNPPRPFGDSLRAGPPPTDRLGVYLREPSGPSGGDDVGLRVESVLPGSLAEALGVRAGDLLLKLDGTPLRSAADVRTALGARAADAEISLERQGADGARSVLRWRPSH